MDIPDNTASDETSIHGPKVRVSLISGPSISGKNHVVKL